MRALKLAQAGKPKSNWKRQGLVGLAASVYSTDPSQHLIFSFLQKVLSHPKIAILRQESPHFFNIFIKSNFYLGPAP